MDCCARCCVIASHLFVFCVSPASSQDTTTLRHVKEIEAFVVSPGGHYVAAWERSDRIIIWDVHTTKKQALVDDSMRKQKRHDVQLCSSAVFSRSSSILATVQPRAREVRIWRRKGARWELALPLRVMKFDEREMYLRPGLSMDVAFRPVFSRDEKSVFIPIVHVTAPDPDNVDSPENQGPLPDDISALFVFPATIQQWDLVTKKKTPFKVQVPLPWYAHLRHCPKDRLLLAPSWERIVAFDLATGELRYAVPSPKRYCNVRVSADDRYAAALCTKPFIGGIEHVDHVIQLWQVSDGKVLQRLHVAKGARNPMPCFSPDSKTLAFCTDGTTIQRYDIEEKKLSPPTEEDLTIDTLYFRHDGVLMAASNVARTIVLWKVDGKKRKGNEESHGENRLPDTGLDPPQSLTIPFPTRNGGQ